MTFAALLIALATTLPTGLPAGSGDPIMLDFTATWCGPCQSVRPAVEQLVQNGYPIKAIDLDTNQSLAERYDVHEVPTFLVIEPGTGRELGRIKGAQPASALANFYNQAAAKARPSANRAQPKENTEDEANEGAETEETPAAAPAPSNPKPWETVVRIKVHGNGAIGFGSGTIIASTPEESLILTCAHIFKIEHAQTPPPRAFPRKITIDLFDGNLSGPKRNQVHYTNETLEGEAVDYDFNLDVGLIRIRPGRRLAYSKVVPAHWKPKTRMGMITVGCSEGHDATAWNTIVANPAMKGLNGNRLYEAIECMNAPKQGRSGGGLFI